MCLIRIYTYIIHTILILIVALLFFAPHPIISGGGVKPLSMVDLEISKEKVNHPVTVSKLPENKDKPLTLDNLHGRHGGQCVEFIQSYLNLYQNPYFKGKAIDIPLNANYPEIGWVVLTTEGPVGHVALIIDINEENNILTLAESNFNHDELITVGRKLSLDAGVIRGFFAVKY